MNMVEMRTKEYPAKDTIAKQVLDEAKESMKVGKCCIKKRKTIFCDKNGVLRKVKNYFTLIDFFKRS